MNKAELVIMQKHVVPQTPSHKQSNVNYSIRCKEGECKKHYVGETKQQLYKRLYQHQREN